MATKATVKCGAREAPPDTCLDVQPIGGIESTRERRGSAMRIVSPEPSTIVSPDPSTIGSADPSPPTRPSVVGREAIVVSEKEADHVDPDATGERPVDEHLQDLPDGSGCVEIWERLSERREATDE